MSARFGIVLILSISKGIKSFEELDAWRMAKVLSVEIYLQTREGMVSKDFGFRDQIRNAALSIMNNISEGYGRRSDRAFCLFLGYARGSVAEVESMLILGAEIGYFEKGQVEQWRHQIRLVSARIHGLIEYLSKKPDDPNEL